MNAARRSIPADAPLHFVVNAAAGSRDDEQTLAAIEQGLQDSARRATLHRVQEPAQLGAVARRAAEAAGSHGVVVAVGGDGTINTVAGAVIERGGMLGLVPRGTFNYFARSHGVPTEPAAAVELLRTGADAEAVQAARVNERLFLVNASLGLYPRLLEDRETFKRQYGRSRVVAIGAAIASLMRDHRRLDLRIEDARGGARTLATTTLFVGNNRLQLEQLGLDAATQVDTGQLAGLVLRAFRPGELLWIALRGALGRLGDADDVISFTFHDITVAPLARWRLRSVKVATDGEVTRLRPPLNFRPDPQPLWLLKPLS